MKKIKENNLDNFLDKFIQTTDFPTLDAMFYIMEKLGNPHQKLKFVHIAGTNGKGSIVEMLNKVLLCTNKYKIGKFISPHLCISNESIQINSTCISPIIVENYIPIFENLEQNYFEDTGRHLTRFEVLTSMAILYFFENNCDLVILEVGLGGLYDCTNIVSPLVSAFGNISFDHTAILGNTLEEIAFQKAGIIKENSNSVIFDQPAISTIQQVCAEKNNRLICIKKENIKNYYLENSYQYFTYKNNQYRINLKGKKQIENACVVIEIINILQNNNFEISYSNILEGLKTVVHPARFEKISDNPIIFYDGAHNEDAIKNLIDTIKTNFPSEKKHFVVSIIQTKDYKTLLDLLVKAFENCSFTFNSGCNNNHKFFDKEILYNYAKSLNSNNMFFKAELQTSLESLYKQDSNIINFVIGSFYNYKATKEIIENIKAIN